MNNNYKTKEDILRRAKEIIGIPLGEIDETGRLNSGKGSIGTVIEESWYHYSPNSESAPDFPEAGVELKVTPYVRNKSGTVRAKERLVCNIINYMTEYAKDFYTSSFWHKCETILLMSYEHQMNVAKKYFSIDKALLFSFPEEDLIIIKQDWEKIIEKIRSGHAHELTEGDTLYLGACTKGATAAKSLRKQPFSEIPAKQRAYCLKSSYMTYILNKYVFGKEEDEHIIHDVGTLKQSSFEDVIKATIRPYLGKTQTELKNIFGIESTSKSVNELILSSIFGVKTKLSKTAEFSNANILPKTIRIQKNGNIKESMSFPTFKFTEIIKQTWEDSDLKNYLEPIKFMFVIFQEDDNGEYRLARIKFWNIPFDDLEEVHKVWERTVQIIKDGVLLYYDGKATHNNLPKQTESRVAHVRPHGRDAKDTYPLPDGRQMTKQCFWFNRTYIKDIIIETSKEKLYHYDHESSLPIVAESKSSYRFENKRIPYGAIIHHPTFGEGQVISVTLSFDNHPLCEYPYLIGKRDEFSIDYDGLTVYHKRFGTGKVHNYKISFKDIELAFSPNDFKNRDGRIEVISNQEKNYETS